MKRLVLVFCLFFYSLASFAQENQLITCDTNMFLQDSVNNNTPEGRLIYAALRWISREKRKADLFEAYSQDVANLSAETKAAKLYSLNLFAIGILGSVDADFPHAKCFDQIFTQNVITNFQADLFPYSKIVLGKKEQFVALTLNQDQTIVILQSKLRFDYDRRTKILIKTLAVNGKPEQSIVDHEERRHILTNIEKIEQQMSLR